MVYINYLREDNIKMDGNALNCTSTILSAFGHLFDLLIFFSNKYQ